MSGDEMNQDQARRPIEPPQAQYVTGWFTKQFADPKVVRKYGYPANHLPSVDDGPIEMVTGFVASGTSSED